jgi:CRISPR type I-E-associated protein CasB/Cse2
MLDRNVCQRFAARLLRLHQPPQSPTGPLRRPDLGTLACLRRGLGKPFGEEGRRDGWVLSTLDECRRLDKPETSWYTDTDLDWACCVASLFASHSNATPDRFAAAFRHLWKSQEEAPSVARRFAVLLESDRRDLPTHLRHAVKLLKASEIGLDWASLLFDLGRWDDSDRRVQRRWSRDFWTESHAKHPGTQQPSTIASPSE